MKLDPGPETGPGAGVAAGARNGPRFELQRASGRWQGYEPCAEVTTIEAFCNTVEDDVYGCFWG